jgi:soluble lytic murein transglycosylase
MGAWYLNYLGGRVPGTIFSLAAYNAGQGRARGWAATFGNLPPILQVEAIPFIETRWYVRRIALSQAVYANILSGEPIAAAIRRFFGV